MGSNGGVAGGKDAARVKGETGEDTEGSHRLVSVQVAQDLMQRGCLGQLRL